MLSRKEIKDLVRDCLATLNAEKPEDRRIPVADDTVLLGAGTLLDSLDFVTVITDVEERLHTSTGREVPLATDSAWLGEHNPFRTVSTLSEHVEALLRSAPSDD